MIKLDQIHPVTDFVRNYKSYLNRIKSTGNPEVLTVNGVPEYVILDAASYQAISSELERIKFVEAVKEGIADLKSGGGKSAAQVLAEVRSELGL